MTCIRPILEYADSVWAGGNLRDLDLLEKLQLDAARVVTGATARCNNRRLLEDLGWPTLSSRRQNHHLILFYKIVNGLSPPYLQSLKPPLVRERTTYHLRSHENISVPFARLQCFEKSFILEGSALWNDLHHDIRHAPNVGSFKNKLTPHLHKNHLFNLGNRWPNVQMARLRIGCSGLNSHLCLNLHVIESPQCICGHINENPEHYIFDCRLFTEQRNELNQTLSKFEGHIIDIDDILYGCPDLSWSENKDILFAVHKFINESGRLKPR